MTFSPDQDRVRMDTSDGPCWLNLEQVDQLLAIYEANSAHRLWLALDEAAQAAGYPPSVSSLRAIKGFVPEPAIDGRGTQSPRSLAAQHFDGKVA